ncbi:MAG: pyridoxamine 5'-phosphate oxidase family protein [Pseudomonadota bacterium]
MPTPLPHEPRLSRDLRTLLTTQRVAALGTLGLDGLPFVSMVPFALEPHSASVVIHVSGLAAHTRNLQAAPNVSLLVMQSETAGEPVHALPRVTLIGQATALEPGNAAWAASRAAYLARFPEAEPMTELGDFMFVAIQVSGARQVAGFGAARSLDTETIKSVLQPL